MLRNHGFETDIAGSAEEAKRLLEQRDYDAMTVDLALPGQDGISLIHELRDSSNWRWLPIVVVSAYAQAGKARTGGGFPVVDWIDKPIDERRLLAALNYSAIPGEGTQARVLHVEDDSDVRRIVASLAGPGMSFDHASTLSEARSKLSMGQYQMVILDLVLPDGSGWELLPLLDRMHPPPPVLVFSASEVAMSEAGKVASALLKSRTTNDELARVLHALVRRGTANLRSAGSSPIVGYQQEGLSG